MYRQSYRLRGHISRHTYIYTYILYIHTYRVRHTDRQAGSGKGIKIQRQIHIRTYMLPHIITFLHKYRHTERGASSRWSVRGIQTNIDPCWLTDRQTDIKTEKYAGKTLTYVHTPRHADRQAYCT